MTGLFLCSWRYLYLRLAKSDLYTPLRWSALRVISLLTTDLSLPIAKAIWFCLWFWASITDIVYLCSQVKWLIFDNFWTRRQVRQTYSNQTGGEIYSFPSLIKYSLINYSQSCIYYLNSRIKKYAPRQSLHWDFAIDQIGEFQREQWLHHWTYRTKMIYKLNRLTQLVCYQTKTSYCEVQLYVN